MAWRYWEVSANSRESAIRKFRKRLSKDGEVMGKKFTCHKIGKSNFYACNTHAHKKVK